MSGGGGWEHEALDRSMLRDYEHMTSGADFHHIKQPDELAMYFESGVDPRNERDALREEIFSAVCQYTISEGPHPEKVMERMEALMRRFGMKVLGGMKGRRKWWDDDAVSGVCAKFGEAVKHSGRACSADFLLSVSRKMREELDEEFTYQSFHGLCRFWVCDGWGWRNAYSVHMALVKGMRPSLLTVMARRNGADVPVMMSLDDLAVLCGDAGKATVSARVKRVINRRMEGDELLGTFLPFQKSASAVEKYRAAQRGNTNRRKKDQ